MSSILVVQPDEASCRSLEAALARNGRAVASATTADGAAEAFRRTKFGALAPRMTREKTIIEGLKTATRGDPFQQESPR